MFGLKTKMLSNVEVPFNRPMAADIEGWCGEGELDAIIGLATAVFIGIGTGGSFRWAQADCMIVGFWEGGNGRVGVDGMLLCAAPLTTDGLVRIGL